MMTEQQEQKKLTSKQKLDQILGIDPDQSVDSFLDSLDAETSTLSSLAGSIADETRTQLDKLDSSISAITTKGASTILELHDIDTSMKEIEELIQLSKKMFKHIYENFCSTDLLDAELIGSASKLLESIHVNIAEFVMLYKEKQQFIDKIKVMVLQQEQRKELETIKHQHAIELAQMRIDQKTITQDDNLVNYKFEDLIRKIDENT